MKLFITSKVESYLLQDVVKVLYYKKKLELFITRIQKDFLLKQVA